MGRPGVVETVSNGDKDQVVPEVFFFRFAYSYYLFGEAPVGRGEFADFLIIAAGMHL